MTSSEGLEVDKNFSKIGMIVAFTAIAFAASAQTYPSKPIRILIPFPPGNTMDIMARLIAPKLSERLGQNVIVDNRAGAAGQLGMEIGKNSPPDGYTIIAGQGGNMVVMPHTYKKLPYDVFKDFAPIAWWCTRACRLKQSRIWLLMRRPIRTGSPSVPTARAAFRI